MTTPLEPGNQSPDTKKLATRAAGILGALLVATGGITLAANAIVGNDDTPQEQQTTAEDTTTQETTAKETDNPAEDTVNPDNAQQNAAPSVENPAPDGRPDPQRPPAFDNLSPDDAELIDGLFQAEDSLPGLDEIVTSAETTRAYGETLNANGLEVRVSNPRVENGTMTVDVSAKNTTDKELGFSGFMFGAGTVPENADIATMETYTSFNPSGRIEPKGEITGSLDFDLEEQGYVFYVDFQDGKSHLWK